MTVNGPRDNHKLSLGWTMCLPLNGYDSLNVVVWLLEDHLPMATTNEQSTIQQVLIPGGDVELMKRYISVFDGSKHLSQRRKRCWRSTSNASPT